jgi:MGT family glycosyltransferase
MAHLGFLSLNLMGHLFPMSTLARELRDRGHRVTFFCFADAHEFLQEAGLETVVVARAHFPRGYVKQVSDTLGQLNGAKGVSYTIQLLCHEASVQFAELPDAIQAAGVDALVIDQFAMSGATIAQHLRKPYVHVAAALMANVEDGLPPINVGWGPQREPWALFRNNLATMMVKRLFHPVRKTLNEQRRLWGLPAYKEFFNERFSGGPQISQEPLSFEFPRKMLPADFHFVGPLHRNETRSDVPFPWERLDGRPLVYASMGTLQNGLEWVFRTFAEGCAGLEAQLVLSLGGNLDPATLTELPGDPILVRFAPQLRLLEHAAVCITHAGLNTVLEALAHGVPMVAIPITNDQPGVAARIAWTGTGRCLRLKKLTPRMLQEAVRDVLTTPSYRDHARRLQREIASTDPLQQACEVVQSLLS